MGFLSRFTGRPESGVSRSALTLPGAALVSVVGESHRQPAIEQTLNNHSTMGVPPLPISVDLRDERELPWFQAVLVREPNNAYDENAIMVYSTAGHLGYLARGDAEDYQELLEEVEARGSQAGACSAFLRQADNGMWGVVLVLSSPDECLEDLDA
jgi:HIRAN domain